MKPSGAERFCVEGIAMEEDLLWLTGETQISCKHNTYSNMIVKKELQKHSQKKKKNSAETFDSDGNSSRILSAMVTSQS